MTKNRTLTESLFEQMSRLSFIGTPDRARDLLRLVMFYGAGQLVWLIVVYELIWFTEFGASTTFEVVWAWGLWGAFVGLFSLVALVQALSYLGIYHYPFIRMNRHWFVAPSVIVLYVMATVLAASVNSADVQAQHMLLPLVTLAPLVQIYALPVGIVLGVLGTAVVAVFYPDLEPISAAYYFLQQVVLLVMTRAFVNEKYVQEALTRRNDELGATQVLLSEASRQNERLRIARNIHDLVGHHVTALSLNLEAISHRTEGEVQNSIREVQQIARELLEKVRAAVSEYRMDVDLPLAEILAELTSHAPGLNVELDLESDLVIRDAAVAEAILRAAQEVVTNTMKHSGATNLFIQLQNKDGQLHLVAIDDGRGVSRVKPGNGLRGMAERVEALGGELKVDGGKNGFKLSLTIPIIGEQL